MEKKAYEHPSLRIVELTLSPFLESGNTEPIIDSGEENEW